jgi:hypothetical protein
MNKPTYYDIFDDKVLPRDILDILMRKHFDILDIIELSKLSESTNKYIHNWYESKLKSMEEPTQTRMINISDLGSENEYSESNEESNNKSNNESNSDNNSEDNYSHISGYSTDDSISSDRISISKSYELLTGNSKCFDYILDYTDKIPTNIVKYIGADINDKFNEPLYYGFKLLMYHVFYKQTRIPIKITSDFIDKRQKLHPINQGELGEYGERILYILVDYLEILVKYKAIDDIFNMFAFVYKYRLIQRLLNKYLFYNSRQYTIITSDNLSKCTACKYCQDSDAILATIHHAFYTKRVLAMVIDWSQHITIIDELGIISDIYTKSLNLRFISPKYAKKILGNSYYKQIVNIINSDVNNMLIAQSLKSDDEVYHDYLYGI